MGGRTPLQQTYANFTIAVKTSPTPINASIDISSMIQSFTLSNPAVNTNSVFYGDSGVTASVAGTIGTGIELATGTTKDFIIRQERVAYELQDPLLLVAQKELCQTLDPYNIPLIVWKLNDFWLVANVATTISCMVFRTIFM